MGPQGKGSPRETGVRGTSPRYEKRVRDRGCSFGLLTRCNGLEFFKIFLARRTVSFPQRTIPPTRSPPNFYRAHHPTDVLQSRKIVSPFFIFPETSPRNSHSLCSGVCQHHVFFRILRLCNFVNKHRQFRTMLPYAAGRHADGRADQHPHMGALVPAPPGLAGQQAVAEHLTSVAQPDGNNLY